LPCCRGRGQRSAAASPRAGKKARTPGKLAPVIPSDPDDETYTPAKRSSDEDSASSTDSEEAAPVDHGPTIQEQKTAKKLKRQSKSSYGNEPSDFFDREVPADVRFLIHEFLGEVSGRVLKMLPALLLGTTFADTTTCD
jgi:hypothetical protein